jgi:hypothetical protein
MSEEKRLEEELTFGEELLRMQSFSAARAARYRAEMEKLLVHQIPVSERWWVGLTAVVLGGVLTVGGIAIGAAGSHPEYEGLDAARWTVAVACALTGLLFGGWLLRIAIQGGYARRLGDVIGLSIALVLCGGWATSFMQLAWGTNDELLRIKLLSVAGVLLAVLAGCLLLALFQRMHRQTQEKLLRIEYHLAELLERNAGSVDN